MSNINETKLRLAVGANIRKYRTANGLDQYTLGSKIEMERTSISNIESGKQRCTVFALYRISAVLDVPVLELLPSIDDFIEYTIKTANGSNVTIGAKTFAALQKYRPLLKTTITK